MSDTNAQEPTMEEILASIRRIISEDDAPAAAAPAPAEAEPEAAAAPEPEPAPPPPLAAVPDEEPEDDVLELTEPAPAPAAFEPEETLGDIEVFPRPSIRKPDPEPAPPPAFEAYSPAAYDGEEEDDGLISPPAASQAASAFSQLSRQLAMPSEGRTLEDVVREMLRPMLKDWLDTHLSQIVETAVQAEVERISRRRI